MKPEIKVLIPIAERQIILVLVTVVVLITLCQSWIIFQILYEVLTP